VHTIFFGGGTPSLLSPQYFAQILQIVRSSFDLFPSDTLEASLEANPGTVNLASLRDLRQLGFNRISFGVQSAHPDELRQLERIHDFYDVIHSVEWARQAGFDNLNLDLIYGLPEQTLERWQATVKRAIDLNPEHLSLYALTVEPGTPFGRWAARGLMLMPDPDLAADMYEWAEQYLEAKGFVHYEISNWAKMNDEGRMQNDELEHDSSFCIHHSAFECNHNLQYWRNQPYLGFGAGAHGYANRMRVANVLRIKTYIEHLQPDYSLPNNLIPNPSFPLSPATVSQTRLTPRVEMQETMLTGLRLTQEGVSAAAFQERFGVGLKDVFGKEIDELIGLGLLEWVHLPLPLPFPCREGGRRGDRSLRLTKRGRLLGNRVFMRFVGE